MEPPKIVVDARDADARVWELLGVSRDELAHIARAASAAKADAIDDDPITTPGTFAYIFGTRALRRLFRARGWRLNREGGIESVCDPERSIKVVFQNADIAADEDRDPKAISDKGSSTEKALVLAQGSFFFMEPTALDNNEVVSALWYLFVSMDDRGKYLRAELSLPKIIEDKQFRGFYERVFIINKGEDDEFRFDADEGGPAQDVEPIVTRK